MQLSGPSLARPVDLFNVLEVGLATKPDTLALTSASNSWTWRQLEQTSGRLARNLLGLGLEPGDRVASLMPNRCELIIHYLACIRAGLIAAPLNYRYMAPEIDHALEVSGTRILLFHTERESDLSKSRLAAKLPLGLISYGSDGPGTLSFSALCSTEAPPKDLSAPKSESPGGYIFNLRQYR